MNFNFPEGPPGVHPPTAAFTRLLTFKGVRNPISNQPFSEALLFGIGGGIDTGYILFKFPHLPQPMLVLGFRNQWNHTRAFFENLAERIYLPVDFVEFENQEQAEEGLQNTLSAEKPAIVWVDKAHLPYHHLPEYLKGLINYQVGVYARDASLWRLYLDDMCTQPIEISEKIFSSARAKLNQGNFLMMVLNGAEDISANELRDAVIEGIRDCAAQLTRPINTIGISNLETWSEKLIDHNDRLGWRQVFQNKNGLYIALRTIYESIKLNGTEGFALRKLYGDFLHEAAGILNNPSLNAITGQYLQLANHWSSLAENALPSKIPDFDRVKNLLNKKYDSFRKNDLDTFETTVDSLVKLEERILTNFPLDSYQTNRLFERLSGQIKLIAELETNAAHRLRDVTKR
jgi:hypothetical protein